MKGGKYVLTLVEVTSAPLWLFSLSSSPAVAVQSTEMMRKVEKLRWQHKGEGWVGKVPVSLWIYPQTFSTRSKRITKEDFLDKNLNQKYPIINSPLFNFCECVGREGGDQIKEVWFRLHTKELKLVWLSFGNQKNMNSSKPNRESFYEIPQFLIICHLSVFNCL